MRQHLILATAGALALAAATLTSGLVRAECPYLPPDPPVTKAIPTARTILVGTVLEQAPGKHVAIRLRIDHVLRGRGEVGAIREFETLYANWPLAHLDDGTILAPCESMSAQAGDVIALALGALAPDGRTRYNGLSWIIGQPPFYRETWETTTLAELKRLADLPRTDSADPASAGSRVEQTSPTAWFLVGLVSATIIAASVDRRARRRAR